MIQALWAGGTVAIADDGTITATPADRISEVYAALGRRYVHTESIELTEGDDAGTIVEVVEPIDRSTPEHLKAALLALPGGTLIE